MLLHFMITMTVATATGLLFLHLHVPLPWLLGPLAGALAWRQLRPDASYWPEGPRSFGLMVLGYLLGRPFTAEVCLYITSQLPLMLTMTVALVLFCLAMGYVTHRQTGLSMATSVLGTVPGGLAQMSVLGEEIVGADVSAIVFMQTIRIMSVVFTVPFLAIHGLFPGAGPAATVFPSAGVDSSAALLFVAAVVLGTLAGIRLRLPTPHLLGPMLTTAVLVASGLSAPAVPPPLVITAQIFIGAHLGYNMTFASLDWRRILGYTLLNIITVLIFCVFVAYVLAGAIPTTMLTAFLSAAPGGVAEMGVTALLLGADVSVVVGYHMFRVLFVLLIMPLFLRQWLRAGKGAD